MKSTQIALNVQNEIDHKIKNNLNIISSILGLQILDLKNSNDKKIKDILTKNKLRIEAIAIVYDASHKNKDSIKVNFKKYVKNLNYLINRTYNSDIKTKISSNNIALSLNTMLKISMILNELFTNSFKHIFSLRVIKKDIDINLKRKKNNSYILTYHEKSGKIIDIEKIKQSKTLGIKLIMLIAKQMKAHMHIRQDAGLIFVIEFDCEE